MHCLLPSHLLFLPSSPLPPFTDLPWPPRMRPWTKRPAMHCLLPSHPWHTTLSPLAYAPSTPWHTTLSPSPLPFAFCTDLSGRQNEAVDEAGRRAVDLHCHHVPAPHPQHPRNPRRGLPRTTLAPSLELNEIHAGTPTSSSSRSCTKACAQGETCQKYKHFSSFFFKDTSAYKWTESKRVHPRPSPKAAAHQGSCSSCCRQRSGTKQQKQTASSRQQRRAVRLQKKEEGGN